MVNLVNFCDGSCGFQSGWCDSSLLQTLILFRFIRRSNTFVLIVKVDIVVGDVIDNIKAILFLMFVSN